MTGTPLANAAIFLIQTLFGLYILAVMLRFLLQTVRADFYNPVSQFLVQITSPVLRPLRRIVPGFAGLDMAAIVLMIALQLLELVLVGAVAGGVPSPASLIILTVASLLSLLLYVFTFSILIQVVLSWVNPGLMNPVTLILHQLNEPVLAPARRLLPPISGVDLSPLVVLIVIQFVLIGFLPYLYRAAGAPGLA